MLLMSGGSVPVVDEEPSCAPGLLCRVPQKVTKFNKLYFLAAQGMGGEGMFPAQIAFISEEAISRKVGQHRAILPKLCSILQHLTL